MEIGNGFNTMNDSLVNSASCRNVRIRSEEYGIGCHSKRIDVGGNHQRMEVHQRMRLCIVQDDLLLLAHPFSPYTYIYT